MVRQYLIELLFAKQAKLTDQGPWLYFLCLFSMELQGRAILVFFEVGFYTKYKVLPQEK